MKEHRAVASHSADFSVQEDSAGAVSIQSLLPIAFLPLQPVCVS